jgi:hypothetical protein
MDGNSAVDALHEPIAGEWLHDGSLDEVTEINRQALDLMVAMAVNPTYSSPVLVGSASAWRDMPERALEALATSPSLLVDAYFADAIRWKGALRVDTVHEPADVRAFVGRGAEEFIRRVLVLGWHLARADRQLARMVLGMPAVCADHLSRLRLKDIDWMAQHRAGWVRPRWEQQPRLWRNLLESARQGHDDELLKFRARGLQLMAAASVPVRPIMPFSARSRAPQRPPAGPIPAPA